MNSGGSQTEDALNEHAQTVTAPAALPATERPAIRDAASWLRFAFIGLGGLWLDLWSKTWAFDTLGQRGRRVLIDHVLEFQTMLNPGALFGIGGGKTALFLVASVFALVLVGWMFSQTSSRRWLLHIALGGILAGAIGNMYDRMFVRLVPDKRLGVYMVEVRRGPQGVELQKYPPKKGGPVHVVQEIHEPVGYVRDFIKIPTRIFGRVDLWPWVFNVADMLLVGGVCILAIYLWRDRRHPANNELDPDDANVEIATDTPSESEGEAPAGAANTNV